MDHRIVQFISALRSSGVRVSLAESSDAFQAIDQLGVQDRQTFRTSLRTTLIKDSADIPHFEQLFPLFFGAAEPPPMLSPNQELTPGEAQMIAEALRRFTEQIRHTLQKLLEGRPLTPQELDQLDALLNMDNQNDPRAQSWLANKMEQALQFREIQKAIEELMQVLAEMGMDAQRLEQLQQMLGANQQALQEQIRRHVGQRLAQNLSEQNPHQRLDGLYNRPFTTLTEEEMKTLHREVRRLAAALRTRLALRLKRARNGQLDVKATLRTNLKHGNVPFELKHRNHTLKPKIVVLCDLSTSMRYCSELMLSFLYTLQDQISKTHAFAYIDHLEYISTYFQGQHPAEAVTEILRRMPSGHYNTDLGHSLENFAKSYLDTIDHRTTFIVVGDARNNFNDPQLETFREITRRCRASIWLNPEVIPQWGNGDSDMLKYAPLCQRTLQVSNLAQLSEAIDQLLLQS